MLSFYPKSFSEPAMLVQATLEPFYPPNKYATIILNRYSPHIYFEAERVLRANQYLILLHISPDEPPSIPFSFSQCQSCFIPLLSFLPDIPPNLQRMMHHGEEKMSKRLL